MIVTTIHYSKQFIKDLKTLPPPIIKLAAKKEKIFRENPLHSSLQLHELHGKFEGIWSISITSSYRIIFDRMKNGDIVFVSIGKHDVYKYL